MDVGFYLGELLMQQGEVSVPGLGHFLLQKIGSYYNEHEHIFYPPYHKAAFDLQHVDDDKLAQFIAIKKNISVESATYFCEKYITGLSKEAQTTEVPIGNLGRFYTDQARLTFKPAEKIIDDGMFFGFEPVKATKADTDHVAEERPKVQITLPPTPQPVKEEVIEAPTPVVPLVTIPEPVAVPEPVVVPEPIHIPEPVPATIPEPVVAAIPDPIPAPAPVTPFVEEEVFEPVMGADFFENEEEEYEERRGPLRLILVVLAVIILIGVGVFALYRYKPDTFAKIQFWNQGSPAAADGQQKARMLIADPVKMDSAKTDTAGVKTADTAAKTAPAVTATTPPATIVGNKALATPVKGDANITTKFAVATGTRRFEVLVAPDYPDMAAANAAITKLRSLGLDAKIIPDIPGPLKHISIGNFKTRYEAMIYADKVAQSGKVTNNVYPQEIIPQK